MKLYRILTLAVIAALGLSFASCSDDDDDNNNFSTAYLPKTITEKEGNSTSTYTTTFSYDDDNRLTGWVDEYETYTVIYAEDGKIESLDIIYKGTKNGYKTYFEYSGNTIKVIDEDGEIEEVITINGNGTIKSVKDEDSIEEYSYSGKNMTGIKEEYEDGGKYTSKGTSKYDGKAGVFRNINTPQWFLYTQVDSYFGVQNNIISSEYTEYQDGVESYKSSSSCSYEYNTDSYPTLATAKYTWKDLADDANANLRSSAKTKKRNLRSSVATTATEEGNTYTTTYTISYYTK